jgi:tetratricopeptide (TPR) repeat protein
MQKKWDDAEQTFARAIEVSERAYGPYHLSVADALINLAEHNLLRRDFARAENLFRRTLAIREELFGKDHVDTAITYSRLAIALGEQKRYDEAHKLFLIALPILERTFGPEAPEVAFSLEHFGRLLRQMQDTARAEQIEARARAIRDVHAFTISADQLRKR